MKKRSNKVQVINTPTISQNLDKINLNQNTCNHLFQSRNNLQYTNIILKQLDQDSSSTLKPTFIPDSINISNSKNESSPTIEKKESEKNSNNDIPSSNQFDNYSYSYESSYTYSESDDTDILKDYVNFFQQLRDNIGPIANSELESIKHEYKKTKSQYQQIVNEIAKMESSITVSSSETVWLLKQYFTELIDFIDHYDQVDISEVKPEYTSLSYVLDRLRTLRRMDSTIYNRSGIPNAVGELFEFFATFQVSHFDLKGNIPILDMDWIRAGWHWLSEDGDPDIVPKIFEKTAIPIFLEQLSLIDFETEEDWRRTWLHCCEMTDYCIHDDFIGTQLANIMKKRLNSAYGTAKLSAQTYNKLMIEFGFKQQSIHDQFMYY